MNLCECGCGQPCKNRFVRFHASKLIMTEEVKRKISKANKGRKVSQDVKNRISKSHKGKTKEYLKGKKQTPEHIAMRSKKNTGKKRTQEQKDKISKALKGKPKSKEHIEKIKETRINFYHTEENKKKISDSLNKFYSTPESKKTIAHIQKTKRKNKSYNKSKSELNLKDYIEKYYPGVICQYYDAEKYPHACDFYIPSLDLFIEYNGTCFHGPGPYDPNNVEHQKLLKKWESRSDNKFYAKCIEIWTISDVQKRREAKENKLNYIEITSQREEDRFVYILDIISKYRDKKLQGYTLIAQDCVPYFSLDYQYPQDLLERELNNYYNNEGKYSKTPLYNRIILNYQSSFYKTEKELWGNPKIRDKLIKNRFEYLSKRLEDITIPEFLSGFKKSGIKVSYSHFSPYWIKTFIKEYDIKSVLDINGGWGHRYLGSLSIHYIYNDTDPEKYKDIQKIHNFAKEKLDLPKKVFLNEDSSSYPFNENYEYDSVFTCPPYYNKENYPGINSSTIVYTNYFDWLNKWWRKSIKNTLHDKLRYFSFVISEKHKEDMKRICIEEGLIFGKELVIGKNNGSHLSSNKKNSEYLVIFKYRI